MVATGRAPVAVDSAQAPWLAIPPVFNAFRDDAADDGVPTGDAAMSDGASIILSTCLTSKGFDVLCSKEVMEGSM
jgi:hypothetical protein